MFSFEEIRTALDFDGFIVSLLALDQLWFF